MRAWCVGAFLALVLGACAGGSSDGPIPAVIFQISQVTPRDASQNVPLTQEINVVFTRPVDPATLTRDSFCVEAESGDEILGDRLIPPLNRSVVRFVPRESYLPFAVHTLRVTTAVHDRDGRPLDKEYRFQFQTEEAGPVLPVQSQIEDRGALLVFGRWFHRMTLLPSNRFLIVGGYSASGSTLDRAENLIPALGDSFLIRDGPLEARAAHVQVLLRDGRVLIAGGESTDLPFTPLASCEIFDPAAFRFVPAGRMNFARSFAHGTLLPDGRVLVTGGQSLDGPGFVVRDDAEIYDPDTDTWTLVPGAMQRARTTHFSSVLPDGRVLLLGGTFASPSAERFEPLTGLFTEIVGAPLAHHLAAATLLPDGRPFLAGGLDTRGVTTFDPAVGFVGALNSMLSERVFATATAFPDGRVLIVGGMNLNASPVVIHDTVDLYFPVGSTGKLFRIPNFTLPRPTTHHAAALGPDGRLWITGGLPQDLTASGGLPQVTVIRPDP